MRHKYYIGNKLAYFFSTEDNLHLKVDLAIDKNLFEMGKQLIRDAYQDNNIEYELISQELNINDNLFTLADFKHILDTPDDKNYNQYKHLISIDMYNFIKGVGQDKEAE